RSAKTLPRNTSSPAIRPLPPRRGRSAELLVDERGDPSTEGFRLLLRRSLGEDAHDGLGARGAHQYPPVAVQLAVHGLQALQEGRREGSAADAGQILLRLRVGSHHRGRLRQCPALERIAEEKGRREPVTCHVVAQADDVPGLLAAEDAALAVESLEDVTVADV